MKFECHNSRRESRASACGSFMRVLSILVGFLVGCATRGPVGWRTYDAGPFTFSLPADLQKTPEHGIDSYVSEFEDQDMTFTFDYGAYSGESLDFFSRRAGNIEGDALLKSFRLTL